MGVTSQSTPSAIGWSHLEGVSHVYLQLPDPQIVILDREASVGWEGRTGMNNIPILE